MNRYERTSPVRKIIVLLAAGWALVNSGGTAPAAEVQVSEATQACIECHKFIHPGVVEDWLKSRHSKVTPQEAEQYTKNIMAHAYENLAGNKIFNDLENTILGGIQRRNGRIDIQPANAATRAEACYYCHGT
jgi:hypothetical protein